VSTSSAIPRSAVPYFVLELIRASLLVVFGLVIAFTQRHTASFGLITFGVFLLVLSVSFAVLMVGIKQPAQARGLHVWQALVSLVVGALAIALYQAGIVFLLWAIVLWAVLTGVAEIFAGWRMPSGHPLRRDWIAQGGMTVVLALVIVVQPADSVAVVGFLGAWAIIQGVYATIAGLSSRWALRENTGDGHA
jgi:uncharacterized membrane protein HdeD (DUF308 family)